MTLGHTTSARPSAIIRYTALSEYRRNSDTCGMVRLLWLMLILFDFLQDFLDAGHAGLEVSQCGCGFSCVATAFSASSISLLVVVADAPASWRR
jgi:hypothetical protein